MNHIITTVGRCDRWLQHENMLMRNIAVPVLFLIVSEAIASVAAVYHAAACLASKLLSTVQLLTPVFDRSQITISFDDHYKALVNALLEMVRTPAAIYSKEHLDLELKRIVHTILSHPSALTQAPASENDTPPSAKLTLSNYLGILLHPITITLLSILRLGTIWPGLELLREGIVFSSISCPKLFTNPNIIDKFSTEERRKWNDLQDTLREVRQDLGINPATTINVKIDEKAGNNAYMAGTIHSIGGPVLAIGRSFFDQYQSPLEGNMEWRRLLQEIPDDPIQLAKYLDRCSSEKLQHIRQLGQKFVGQLSRAEMAAILAHEVGHAKHHHLLQAKGIIALAITAASYGLGWALLSSLRLAAPYVRFSTNAIPFFDAFFILSLTGIATVTCGQASQLHELEADRECATHGKHLRGAIDFLKQDLVNMLVQDKEGFEETVNTLLTQREWLNSHPNHAKRLKKLVEMAQQPTHPQTTFSKLGIVLSGVGILFTAHNILSVATFYLRGTSTN